MKGRRHLLSLDATTPIVSEEGRIASEGETTTGVVGSKNGTAAAGQGKKKGRRRAAATKIEEGEYRNVSIDALSEEQAQSELEALGREIFLHDQLYYNEAKPVLTDDDFDSLVARAEAIEARFPGALARAVAKGYQSRAERVGSTPQAGRLLPAKHDVAMMSLDNAFQVEDVEAWVTRLRRLIVGEGGEKAAEQQETGSTPAEGVEEEKEPARVVQQQQLDEGLDLVAELKIDGLSVSLRYEDGVLVRGATRGNGMVGEDVTANVKVIGAIPDRLGVAAAAVGPPPRVVEVRGEVFMSRVDFDALNEERAQAGAEPFSNPRNAASGSLRQLDPAETRKRRLGFFAYDLIHHEEKEWAGPTTQAALLSQLQAWGFSCAKPYRVCESLQDMLSFHDELERGRDGMVFDIDGVVYKLNDLALRSKVGRNARAPRWALAHKFSAKVSETTIRSIEVQVGRTGMLTPVAILDPVTVGGVVISRATLHNFDDLARKAVQIGDRVVVRRAGDVIPQVMGLAPGFEEAERAHNSTAFGMPSACPSCGSAVTKDHDQAFLRCTAGLSCPAQVVEKLAHFASRDAFNIKGLGVRRVEELVSWGLLSTPVDIFKLEEVNKARPEGYRLEDNEGWGALSARNLFSSIRSARRVPLDRLIYGLGILHVGLTTAQAIADHFGGKVDAWLEAMKALGGEQEAATSSSGLDTIDGIGPIVGQAVATFMRDARNMEVVEGLLTELEVQEPDDARRRSSYSSSGNGAAEGDDGGAPILEGKRVIFTGTLTTATRAEAEALAKRLGAKTVKAVSKSIDYVIVGADAGSKASKAKELGLKMLNEDEWIAMTANQGV